jgi:hypothetical protein
VGCPVSLQSSDHCDRCHLYVAINRHASPAAVRVPQLRNPTAAQVQVMLSTESDLFVVCSVHLPLNSLQLCIHQQNCSPTNPVLSHCLTTVACYPAASYWSSTSPFSRGFCTKILYKLVVYSIRATCWPVVTSCVQTVLEDLSSSLLQN